MLLQAKMSLCHRARIEEKIGAKALVRMKVNR
jgi:hypothetical protein